MLEMMRKHSRSLLIYILFGIVIAVFIINFGPGSKGCGTSLSESYAAKVAGNAVPEQDFIHAFQLLGYDQEPADAARARGTRQFLMELLIRRELLAQEAERLGFRVADEEVEDRIAQGRILVVGVPRNITQDYRFASVYRDGFDYQKFRQNFCNYFLHTTPKKFIDEQRREILAEKVRDLVRTATKIAPEEVKRDYVERETQAKLKFVRFGARRFEEGADPTPAEIDDYLSKQRDKVKAQYEARSFMYKAVPKEVRVRAILVQAAKDAPPEELAKAEGRARAAADRVAGGGDFAKVAREMSDDKSKARGGDLGWRRGSTGLGPALDEKLFALAKGQTTGVIRTDRGFCLARAEDVRQGDLPLAAVERDLAEDLLRKERAAARAKKEAEQAMVKIKAGAKLEALFPKADEKDENAADDPDARQGQDAKKEDGKKDEPKKPVKKASAPASPDAPRLQEPGLCPRHGNALEDIGVSKEATLQVFGSLKKGQVAGPFEIQGAVPSYVIVELEDRKEPDMAAFEKRKDEIAREVAASKWATVLSDLAHRRCIEARDAGKIAVNPEVLAYGAEEGGGFTPCSGFGMR